MKDLIETKRYYTEKLHFIVLGEFGSDYLIMAKDEVEIYFFHFPQLIETDNYGMCHVRVENIDALFDDLSINQVTFASSGKLEEKPWGQKEFSIVDINGNLLTFGQPVVVNAAQ
jgi:uncharacterized glyoxalase superfamily protein PhnB